jgi:potassium-dependent mechanosensitive channel
MRFKLSVFFFFVAILISIDGYSQNNATTNYPDSGMSVVTDTTLSQNGQYISKIQQMYFILGRITGATDHAIDTKDMEDKLPDIDSNLIIISETVNKQDKRINIRNLQLFQILLGDMTDDLRDWQSTLQDYNKTLINMESDVSDISKDSILKRTRYDKSIDSLYAKQLSEIRRRLKLADSTTSASLDKVDKLQTEIADDFLLSMDLRKKIRQKMSGFGDKITQPEFAYLWLPDSSEANLKLSQMAVPREQKILKYYFKNSWDDRTEMFALWCAFFIWVLVNFITIKKSGQQLPQTGFKVHFLKPVSILSGIVVVLTLAPFFDLHPPAIYTDMLQFWLLVALTILLSNSWPKKLLYPWIAIVVMFVIYSFVPVFMNEVFAQRMLYLILDMLTIVASVLLYRQVSKTWALTWLIKTVIIIAILTDALAVLSNLFGRVTLAQMLSSAAIFSVTQIIALSVFMKIIYEAVYLQMFKMHLHGTKVDMEFATVEKRLKPVLSGLCLVLWLIVFSTNINLYDTVYKAIDHFLEMKRNIGSTDFSFGSIVVFFVIIYAANFIQKNIGYVWGRSDDEIPTKRSKAGSRLLFMRVILLTLGFLLAVAASGLPIDKITIILGALGVGIGLGLQGIVNNLVSGIALIFERPIEVGDSIEIGGNKGTVKEIGLRSTTIISGDGAEIIVPNGDFLSQHIVNWTLSNPYMRIELPLSVPANTDIALASKIITEELKQHPNVLTDRPPSVILNSIDGAKTSLTLFFWCADVRKADQLKSDVLKSIKEKLLASGINML